jgi:hypothetical protein
MLGQGLLILAILAALHGGPPAASGASNTLTSPRASPTAGTTETLFTLAVDGTGTFESWSVTTSWAAGAALLALLAGALLVAILRRRSRLEEEAEALALPSETAALLERRVLRRARVRLPEDPIVSALGIRPRDDDDEPSRGAPDAAKRGTRR